MAVPPPASVTKPEAARLHGRTAKIESHMKRDVYQIIAPEAVLPLRVLHHG